MHTHTHTCTLILILTPLTLQILVFLTPLTPDPVLSLVQPQVLGGVALESPA